jgi:hypothetical protein
MYAAFPEWLLEGRFRKYGTPPDGYAREANREEQSA